jgi:type III restriction enzyme
MPEKKYLYEQLVEEVGKQGLRKIPIPSCITDNLNPKYGVRPYQVDAFQRFICYCENDFDFKTLPSHLLFNMATGSGKTLIMAGLILYLYDKGYRNFLFFVNSTNTIEKTKNNFINSASTKYLFAQGIHVSDHPVTISPVDNFEGANPNNINICFTTIQKLHMDLTTPKENAISFEDFRKHDVVLIADEAHHINAQTKSDKELSQSWEDTVDRIFAQSKGNFLLEFTATHDYTTQAMIEKYRDKVLVHYDLAHFRNDRYSKEVVIVRSDLGRRERILQALILSQYKKEVAAEHRIDLKPVVLFKAQRTIPQSREMEGEFHRMIAELRGKDLSVLRKNRDVAVVGKAFAFFDGQGITDDQLAARLKQDFQPRCCLSVNNDEEVEKNQILLNTLEDKDNPIRAIFAVQKLNEGWDVLNLFDIVRCYEARDSGHSKIGPTTMSEAQLIGRGARYFPFTLSPNDDRYRRRFDGDLGNELRILEELDYHSINNPKYVQEIRTALIDQGMIDEHEVTREMKLKDSFKRTDFFQHGVVWLNRRFKSTFDEVRSFADLGVKQRNVPYHIATGHGGSTVALGDDVATPSVPGASTQRVDVPLAEIDRNIVQSALARNSFFDFDTLHTSFPNLSSVQQFITSPDYLGGLSIAFTGNTDGLKEDRVELLSAVQVLLKQLETDIHAKTTEYRGTTAFHSEDVKAVFTDKVLKFVPDAMRAADDKDFDAFVSSKDWFAFGTVYGTSEEKAFVRMLDGQMQHLGEQYDEIYLVRNEGHFAIYNFSDGRAFEPDFALFLRSKAGDLLMYQLFIEPKGEFLVATDKWKEEFLQKIQPGLRDKTLTLGDEHYRLIGLPFYTNRTENQFKDSLLSALGCTDSPAKHNDARRAILVRYPGEDS